MYKQKYLKYKNKYLILKQNGGGTLHIINNYETETLENIDDDLIKNIPNTSTSNLQPYTITKNGLTYKISKNGTLYKDNYNFELKIEPISSLKIEEYPVTPRVVSPVASPIVPIVASRVAPHVASRVASPDALPIVPMVAPRVVSPVVSRVVSPVAPRVVSHVASPVVSHGISRVTLRDTSFGNPHTHQPSKSFINIVGSQYDSSNLDNTDFTKMINKIIYADTLFIFNDNIEYHNTNALGGGNAAIRIYNKHRTDGKQPQSAGISTGFLSVFKDSLKPARGFTSLDEKITTSVFSGPKMESTLIIDATAKEIIDNEIQEIKDLISRYNYDTIIWSQDETGKLGSSIFKGSLGQDVIDYITDQIKNLDK